MYVIPFELISSIQKSELAQERETDHVAAYRLDELSTRFCRAASGQQVIYNQHFMAVTNRITVNLQGILAVFQVVRSRRSVVG